MIGGPWEQNNAIVCMSAIAGVSENNYPVRVEDVNYMLKTPPEIQTYGILDTTNYQPGTCCAVLWKCFYEAVS